MLKSSGRTLIVGATSDAARKAALVAAGAEVNEMRNADGQVDLNGLMILLAEREANEVLVEAGPTLSGAMLSSELVDELVIYFAPSLLGDSARGMFHFPALTSLQ